MKDSSNLDRRVTEGFGDEWTRFDQSALQAATREQIFEAYFRHFPWNTLPPGAVGADFGCGSGRWAAVVAPRVGKLYCVDASAAALQVARRNLAAFGNCEFMETSVAQTPIADASLDFAYSLGVLHHVPDTAAGLCSCVRKLKAGAPFLLYLYYRFDNRPAWYRAVWSLANLARAVISRLPYALRYWISQLIAVLVYWPAARGARLVRRLGIEVPHLPLQFYADKPFYVMRTDALDRFGTRLERRFTRAAIGRMMQAAGLRAIEFSEQAPFWCAVGYRTPVE
jgi:ubiquinone/menaquinone biosynthesis C-methylase UbiE